MLLSGCAGGVHRHWLVLPGPGPMYRCSCTRTKRLSGMWAGPGAGHCPGHKLGENIQFRRNPALEPPLHALHCEPLENILISFSQGSEWHWFNYLNSPGQGGLGLDFIIGSVRTRTRFYYWLRQQLKEWQCAFVHPVQVCLKLSIFIILAQVSLGPLLSLS